MRLAPYVPGELIPWPLSASIPELSHVAKVENYGEPNFLRRNKRRSPTRIASMQIAVGAGLAAHIAGSIELAADHLNPKAPQLAGFVRGAAEMSKSRLWSSILRTKGCQWLWLWASLMELRRMLSSRVPFAWA
jgi:hypothetical protein